MKGSQYRQSIRVVHIHEIEWLTLNEIMHPVLVLINITSVFISYNLVFS